ncbi:hypothetical protein Gasu2_55090 [Galdieria sulphuraria]|nr:hypothetical protein Gasu2_55090 [Galdieria sulphuraria]
MGRSKYLPPERQRLNEPTRKLPQKADLKSIYSQFQFADSKESTVTVIISCFMRPNSFETVALSFLNQTAPIVDVIAFKNIRFCLRRQSRILWEISGCPSGRKTIEAFIKAYRFAGFVGVLGVRGVIYDNIFPAWLKKLKPSVISRKYGTIQSELSFSSTRPTEIQTHWLSSGAEVDTLFSFWFMPSSWVQLLYLEQPVTTLTAEDIYISYIIQKYLEKPTYYLYSDDPDFCGYLSPELGNHNRSWVDVKDELPNITLSQLHDALSSSFVTSNISSRMYRWVRNAVLASLVERGFYLKRMEKLRRRQGRALLIFPSSFEKNNVEQTIVKCMEEPDTSIWILCRQPDCREYVGSSNFLADILDGPYSIIFSNKIFRIILPNQTSRSSYYSRFLMDITALMRSQKISDISVISPDSLELQTLKLAAQLEEVELHVYDSH